MTLLSLSGLNMIANAEFTSPTTLRSGIAEAVLVFSLGASALGAQAQTAPTSVIPVKALTVEIRKVERVVTADAIIESTHQATVAAETSGRVLSVTVDAGQPVRKGQVLATLDSREAVAGADQAAAVAAQAQSRVTDARQQWERTRSLKERGFVSQAALDQARAALDSAEAGLKAAQSGAALAGVVRSHAQVLAPMDGLIAARLVEPGDLALPGKALFVVHQAGTLRAVANLPAAVLSQSPAPKVVAVQVPAARKSLQPGRVTITPAVDARDLSQRIRVELPDPEGVIPGMTARIELAQGQSERLVVPRSAIEWRGEIAVVFVEATGGKRLLRQVRIGESFAGDWVEILSGLAAGERVLVKNGR